MAGLNRVMLIGNLGDDPEIRSTNGGDVATMRIATNETFKDRDGNKQERTEWHTVVCWNEHLIPVIERFCRKGGKVYVSGQLQTRKWQDNDGKDRYSTEVVMRFGAELVLLDGPQGSGDRDGGGYGRDRDDRGGRSGGRDDRGGRGSSDNRGTRNDRGGGRGGRDDDRQGGFRDGGYDRTSRDPNSAGRGGGGGGRPAPAFDSDLDDDVPF